MQENLLKEVQSHFNEPVLVGFDLCRCIGYMEDDEDCYMITRYPRESSYKYTSLVGGYVFLNRLDSCDFRNLDSLLELNGAPKVEVFLVQDCAERG